MEQVSAKTIALNLESKLSHNFGVTPAQASDEFFYKACVLVVLQLMTQRRMQFTKQVQAQQSKIVYYLSMEFLMGRSLKNSLYNLGLEDAFRKALAGFDVKLERLYEMEPDAGLGNGGLGRLAACFLDALTSGDYPAMGYCIKYEFGIFRQKLVDGWQTELPDFWLPGGSVWLTSRPAAAVDVRFDGHIREWWDGNFHHVEHEDYTVVRAMPHDLMVAGKDGKAVNVLRLWSAEQNAIDMEAFNSGDYVRAMEKQSMAEAISKVLYPDDNHMEGKSLRLRQQYFLVSASMQDILSRHLRTYGTLDNLPEKAAIHINDTHPALAVPELMRYLLDECGYGWDSAWDIVTRTTAYTNHTVMREALECWPIDLFRARLPRIYQIVAEIDNRFRHQVWCLTSDAACVERTAIIQGGVVRMANLCVAACHSVNGVSALHSDLLKETVFQDYYKLMSEKFTNVTNGITHRRWLCQANPALSAYITELIGDGFVKDASKLSALNAFADDPAVLNRLAQIKRANKARLSDHIKAAYGLRIDPDSMFDMQVKRLHEYKRQHLNALHIITDYLYLKNNPSADYAKTYLFGAKAAPGYLLAKQIISMIYHLSKVIQNDAAVRDKLNVIFLEDYRVTLAELMIPAADLSEQISLASTEASGTGNMKLMLNGAVTLGTEDGANIEIHQAVGDDNIIIFGMKADEVLALRKNGYQPLNYYHNNPTLKAAIDFIATGIGGVAFPEIANTLMHNDYYMALADYADYCRAHTRADTLYADKTRWQKMSLANIANAGVFSADRSIKEYCQNIWHASPVK